MNYNDVHRNLHNVQTHQAHQVRSWSSSWLWSIRRWLWLWSVISLFVVLINISVLSRCWSHLVLLLLSFLLLLPLMLTSLILWPWHVHLLLIGNCHSKTSSMWKLQIIAFCAVEVPCNVIYLLCSSQQLDKHSNLLFIADDSLFSCPGVHLTKDPGYRSYPSR